MSKEHIENITVEEDNLSVLLSTEQTTVKKEVFESIEQAIERKNKKRWTYTGISIALPVAGIASIGQGLGYITNAAIRGESEEVAIGGGLIILGSYFFYNMTRTLDATSLAKKQVESLQTRLDRNTNIAGAMRDHHES